jgi:hypothetical protein
MKTLITEVTLQVQNDSFIVFTDYKNGNTTYTGFTPYKDLDEAIFEAYKMVNVWNAEFMSTAKSFLLIDNIVRQKKTIKVN